MSGVDGTWETVTKSPMGDQKATMVLKTDGNALSGSSETPMGKMDFDGGTVDGNDLAWSMEITAPMKMTLEAKATLDGDTLNGTMKMGMFGTFPFSGTRKA